MTDVSGEDWIYMVGIIGGVLILIWFIFNKMDDDT